MTRSLEACVLRRNCTRAACAGHANVATTAIYVKPNKQDLEAVADSLMDD